MRRRSRRSTTRTTAQLVKGVTLGALGRITDRWEVLANIGYLDSEQQYAERR